MRVNEELAAYVKAADAAMLGGFGVRYMSVSQDLHGGLAVAQAAMERGVAADAFVAETATRARFSPSDVAGPDVANAINVRLAALQTLARERDEWKLGEDGRIYRETDGALERIEPASSANGAYGFAVMRAEGASLVAGDEGLPRPSPGASFERMAGGLDIGDAIERYERKLEAGVGYSPGA